MKATEHQQQIKQLLDAAHGASAMSSSGAGLEHGAKATSLDNSLLSTMTPTSKLKKNFLPRIQIEPLLAGIAGGVTSTLILHPLDLLKIRLSGEFLLYIPSDILLGSLYGRRCVL